MKKKARNSPDGDIGEHSRKKQALRYLEGKPRSAKHDPFLEGEGDGPNDLGEVRDNTRKTPYGGGKDDWAANAGKLGDLDPQETDQPSWVNTWSPLNTGLAGAGVTIDENYGVRRPRTQSRQEERFKACNPEFQEGCGDGDWTSAKWEPNV